MTPEDQALEDAAIVQINLGCVGLLAVIALVLVGLAAFAWWLAG